MRLRTLALLLVAIAGCAEKPGKLGEPCEHGGVPCADAAVCEASENNIGQPECEAPGVCAAAAGGCEEQIGPRCGCDGELYESRCAAELAGVVVSGMLNCTPPPELFPCVETFCERGKQYCENRVGGGVGDRFTCLPLVCEGDASGCDCLAGPNPCGDDGTYYGWQECVLEDGEPHLHCLLP